MRTYKLLDIKEKLNTKLKAARAKVREIDKRLKSFQGSTGVVLKKTSQYDWLVDQERLAKSELGALEFEMDEIKAKIKKEELK